MVHAVFVIKVDNIMITVYCEFLEKIKNISSKRQESYGGML